jgi:hypothetical protein
LDNWLIVRFFIKFRNDACLAGGYLWGLRLLVLRVLASVLGVWVPVVLVETQTFARI